MKKSDSLSETYLSDESQLTALVADDPLQLLGALSRLGGGRRCSARRRKLRLRCERLAARGTTALLCARDRPRGRVRASFVTSAVRFVARSWTAPVRLDVQDFVNHRRTCLSFGGASTFAHTGGLSGLGLRLEERTQSLDLETQRFVPNHEPARL